MRWFRFYDEALDDPKVQKLPVALRWHWVNILCLANRGVPRGVLPTMQAVAFALRVAEPVALRVIGALRAAGLLDETPGGLIPHGWKARQLDTDISGESGAYGNHIRWHVGKGIAVGSCPHCVRQSPPDEIPDSGLGRDLEERRGETEEKQRRPQVVFGEQKFDVDEHLLGQWSKAYPALDVSLAIRAAHAWVVANPLNRKSNWHRFLVNWLKREQDRAPARPVAAGPPPKERAWLDDIETPEPNLTPEQRAANQVRVREMVFTALKDMP